MKSSVDHFLVCFQAYVAEHRIIKSHIVSHNSQHFLTQKTWVQFWEMWETRTVNTAMNITHRSSTKEFYTDTSLFSLMWLWSCKTSCRWWGHSFSHDPSPCGISEHDVRPSPFFSDLWPVFKPKPWPKPSLGESYIWSETTLRPKGLLYSNTSRHSVRLHYETPVECPTGAAGGSLDAYAPQNTHVHIRLWCNTKQRLFVSNCPASWC